MTNTKLNKDRYYAITKNLDDRPEYKGQPLKIFKSHKNDYYTLVDDNENSFFAGEEELTGLPSANLTYKVACNLHELSDFYTDSEQEAKNVFRQYVEKYGDGVRLYEAIKPVSEDDEAEWDIVDYFDNDFTDGDWSATNSNNEDYIDIDGGSGRICSIYVGKEAPPENRANAALIVKSNKLYNVLELFVLGLDTVANNPIHSSLMKIGKELLSKAKQPIPNNK